MSTVFNFSDVIPSGQNNDSINSYKRVSVDKLTENEGNVYPVDDIKSLADSIESFGLLQPLLVKRDPGNKKYIIIAGHRRFNAIKYLIEQQIIDEDYLINIRELAADEDELTTAFKLHETNLQTRSLLKLSEEEKIAIIEDYVNLLEKARAQDYMLNGKAIKGKTRELVAERFDISTGTAASLIAKAKGKDNDKPKKSIFESIYKKISKLDKKDLTKEDKEYLIEIRGLIEDLEES